MMPNGPGHKLGVRRSESYPAGHIAGHHLAGHPVISGPAFADVMQQRGQEEQVGAGHVAGERGRPGRGLDEMTVNRIGVQGVALWAVAYPIPVDRKSTRLNSSHLGISYAVFCLKKYI